MCPDSTFKRRARGKTEEKKIVFKNLKQILNAELQLNYPPQAVLYQHINAPPSLKPPMKVSDLTGIPTAYTDPETKLNYSTSEEFSIVRNLPPEIINGYLSIRGAQNTGIL
ncbi:unnamed protein product [Calicophoron daubneyi]|uniref:Vps72/YL1 C-terminal domain-containing protein n=1 Tax=Calicophoron daubneyi TaxID=300641 RepID=A0AAV2TVT7_CALDB